MKKNKNKGRGTRARAALVKERRNIRGVGIFGFVSRFVMCLCCVLLLDESRKDKVRN